MRSGFLYFLLLLLSFGFILKFLLLRFYWTRPVPDLGTLTDPFVWDPPRDQCDLVKTWWLSCSSKFNNWSTNLNHLMPSAVGQAPWSDSGILSPSACILYLNIHRQMISALIIKMIKATMIMMAIKIMITKRQLCPASGLQPGQVLGKRLRPQPIHSGNTSPGKIL